MNDIILLLQVRDADDPMRAHEVECFQRVLDVDPSLIGSFDLLNGPVPESWISGAKMILIGGSGAYSAVGNEPWLDTALDSLRFVHSSGTPTFASCWGFQAMARAMGGTVDHLPDRAEIGSLPIEITEHGQSDPLFANFGESFRGQLGHEDFVTELPPGTTLLARTEHSAQVYRFDGLPVYCTQFHPELSRDDLAQRLSAYPSYVELATGRSATDVINSLRECHEATELLRRFYQTYVVNNRAT